ncbi:MAG: hypothetical protein KVP17_002949 [Porospora cf. gigantea B]|uniref:uncharacterized protein n=2 Tax=Porospora cf. gigantea B TaxID=2853592 RepID=UPI003571BE6F|nr:MAG: hypothetical protein KVP17_002949 [Porospora cf. gigantea B]
MLSFLSGDSSCHIEVALQYDPSRKCAALSKEKNGPRAFIYHDGEDVTGTTTVSAMPSKRVEHGGIRVELIGRVALTSGRRTDFVSASKELCSAGALTTTTQYHWAFRAIDKPYDSYSGKHASVRYFVRATVLASSGAANKELDFLVRNSTPRAEKTENLKMEVGIEDCLHIDFEYNQSAFDVKDVVLGRVFFHLAKIRLKHMELDILKVESVSGPGSGKKIEHETVSKFEIMDGSPIRMESIPVRMFLCGYDLGPSMEDILNLFSVRYYLNLVLVDEDERRYFKKQEITLFRS